MTSLPITPPKARVDVAPKSAGPPPNGGSGTGDFAALLNQTSARTAPAEGQQTRPASSDQPTRRRDDDAARPQSTQRTQAKDDNAPAEAPAPDAARPQDAGTATDQPGTPGDGQPAAGQDAAGQGAQGQPGDAQAQAAAAAAATAVAPQGQAAPATAAAGVAAGATPAPGTGASPVAGQAADAQAQATLAAATGGTVQAAATTATTAATTVAIGPPGPLQIPAELLGGKATNKLVHIKDLRNVAGDASGLPPAPTLPPSATAAAATPTAGNGTGDPGANPNNNGAGAQPQAAVPPTVTTAQPSATPLGTVPTAPGTAQLTRGSVVQTAERVQELVHIATTRAGNARATLQLRPEALGQVDVQLRTTRDGLVATISAHDKAGLDALQSAASELRRTLEDRGVQLHSLDLQLGAGDNGFSNQGDAREASTGRGGGSPSYGLEGDDDVVSEDELTITMPTSTPAGALVDVTA